MCFEPGPDSPRSSLCASWQQQPFWASTASSRWQLIESIAASAVIQGFVIAGASVTWTIGQAVAARWPQRYPIRRATTIGFSLLLIGVLGAAPVLSNDTSLLLTFCAWSVGGLGMGLVFNPTTISAMSYASDGQEGEVSSQIHLADSLGFGLMGAFGGTTVAIADRSSFSLQGAIGTNFLIAGCCVVLGLITGRRAHGRHLV